MPFLIYFFVILIGVGSVLFGLDLLNSPLHPPPNVPIGRSIRHVAAEPGVHVAKAASDIKPAAKKRTAAINVPGSATGHMRADNPELGPVYTGRRQPPANLATTDDTSADPITATKSHNVAAATTPNAHEPAKPDAGQDAGQANAITSAKLTLAADSGDRQQTESTRAQNNCNVEVCDMAYRSFRASDCTYQPSHGLRRLCTKKGGAQATSVAHGSRQSARPAARSDELGEVTRIVRGMSLSEVARRPFPRHDELSETERMVREMTGGRDMGDIAVQRADGTIIIVHTGDAQAGYR
jgi:hypothetical protein